jgi:hypothetical protein
MKCFSGSKFSPIIGEVASRELKLIMQDTDIKKAGP